MESFWSMLKTELVPAGGFQNFTQARSAIFEYIQLFYSPKRFHSALGYQSPVDFETKTLSNKNQLIHWTLFQGKDRSTSCHEFPFAIFFPYLR